MYQVLYRKYRPKVFSDVVGQEHITSTLSKEIETGKLSHAYLFTGSRGTGKTTCAKILSKAVNCLNPVNGNPCNECEICKGLDSGAILDVVEIDAASNNGVENIRDIREEINFTPASCKYRVYIIDEVHMLSIGAFNALLKTLEEPPSHVKFILATTEVHKLPVTIVSRCQRFDFRRVSPEAMGKRMEYIAEKEDLILDEDAVSLISRISDGGMRDALSLLDQCIGHDRHVTSEIVCRVAGMTGKDHLFSLAKTVADKKSADAISLISDLHSSSCDMERLCSDMTNHFRNLMVVKTVRDAGSFLVCTKEELGQYKQQSESFTLETILQCISLLQECMAKIKRGVNRRTEMEMTFIKLCTPTLSDDNEALLRRISELEIAVKTGAVKVAPTISSEPSASEVGTVVKPEPEAPETNYEAPTPSYEDEREAPKAAEEPAKQKSAEEEESIPWAEVLSELQKVNAPLWGVLTGSEAVVRGDFVLIKSNNPTLSSFIRISGNARHVKDSILRVTGREYRLGLYNSNPTAEKKAEPKKDPLQNLISRARDMGVNVDVK